MTICPTTIPTFIVIVTGQSRVDFLPQIRTFQSAAIGELERLWAGGPSPIPTPALTPSLALILTLTPSLALILPLPLAFAADFALICPFIPLTNVATVPSLLRLPSTPLPPPLTLTLTLPLAPCSPFVEPLCVCLEGPAEEATLLVRLGSSSRHPTSTPAPITAVVATVMSIHFPIFIIIHFLFLIVVEITTPISIIIIPIPIPASTNTRPPHVRTRREQLLHPVGAQHVLQGDRRPPPLQRRHRLGLPDPPTAPCVRAGSRAAVRLGEADLEEWEVDRDNTSGQ